MSDETYEQDVDGDGNADDITVETDGEDTTYLVDTNEDGTADYEV